MQKTGSFTVLYKKKSWQFQYFRLLPKRMIGPLIDYFLFCRQTWCEARLTIKVIVLECDASKQHLLEDL